MAIKLRRHGFDVVGIDVDEAMLAEARAKAPIYSDLIQDLNLKPEEVPFLSGETVNADQQGACAGFNKIMAELPETLPNSYVISWADYTCNPDHMHFNSAGYREFGKRYGEKMLTMMGYPIKQADATRGTAGGAYIRRELLKLGRRDVWWIARDEVELPIGRHGREQIAFDKLDPIGHAVLL